MEKGWPRVAETCGDAPRRHDRVSNDGDAVAVWLRYAG